MGIILAIVITGLMAGFTTRTSWSALRRLATAFSEALAKHDPRTVISVAGLILLTTGHLVYYPYEFFELVRHI